MGFEILALTFDFFGKFLIAMTALLVHRRIKNRHKIDKNVLKEMQLEQMVGILGIILIAIGYIIHLYFLGS